MTRYQKAKRLRTWMGFMVALSGYGLFFVVLGLVQWIESGL